MSSKLNPREPPTGAPPPPAAPSYTEARRHPRVELPARCWIEDGEHTLYLRLHDLSRGGLSVRAPVPFAAARRLTLRLELPSGGELRAIAEVVWVRGTPPADQPSCARMGARFLEFLEGEEALYTLLGQA